MIAKSGGKIRYYFGSVVFSKIPQIVYDADSVNCIRLNKSAVIYEQLNILGNFLG